MTVFADSGPKVFPRVAAAGREVDELVPGNGHWLIRQRDITPKP